MRAVAAENKTHRHTWYEINVELHAHTNPHQTYRHTHTHAHLFSLAQWFTANGNA